MAAKSTRRNSECMEIPKDSSRYRLNHKVEEEICHKQIRESLKVWPNSGLGQTRGEGDSRDNSGRFRKRSKSCGDALYGYQSMLVGWKERVEFLTEQLQKWDFDPMLQAYYKRQQEKTLFGKSLPPIPDIKLLTPQREERMSQTKRRIDHNKYMAKYPLDACSVHYHEVGTSKESYWEKSSELREKQIKYAFSHRIHHGGYGLKGSLRAHCIPPVSCPHSTFLVTTPSHPNSSKPLSSRHSRHRGHAKSASARISTSREPQVVRIRCCTASRHFSTKLLRTPWNT